MPPSVALPRREPRAAATQTPATSGLQAPVPAVRQQSNADVQARVGTADPATPQVVPQDERAQTIEAYGRRLWEVVGELMLEEDPEISAARARAMIGQAADVDLRLRLGETVDVDLLPRFPEGDQGRLPAGAFPPAWIQPARILLEMGGGSGASPTFRPEGDTNDLWEAGQTPAPTPWAGDLEKLKMMGREPADYGVPGYQTQSNNLASPEATCNGTSLAMVLERLGYTRDDLVLAIETKLKRAQLAAQLVAQGASAAETKKQMDAFEPDCIELKQGAWKARVLQYLRAENSAPRRDSNYQRLRGATQTDKQLQTWAGDFENDAGMDDLALFMMELLDIDRTTINSGNNASKFVAAVHDGSGTHAGAKPTTERLEQSLGWTNAKARLKTCLEDGGAAMLSIRHKGAGQSGTHIVAIQAVTSAGVTVDDPFGRARADYDAGKSGDAYATPGETRATSDLKNQKDPALDDWKQSAPVTAVETRGESSDWTDDMVRSSWFYLMLFHRGRLDTAAPTVDTTAATTTTGPAAAPAS
ncbi:MAG: hypothetical protein V4850_22010 [Myxococcota bacterium]